MTLRLIPLLVVALFSGPLSAQDFEFDTALKELRKAQKEQLDSDQIHFAKLFSSSWEKLDDRQKGKALKALTFNLRSKSDEVREATVGALALMGGGKKQKFSALSTKILIAETKRKETEENPGYFVAVLDGIGKLQHRSGIKVLEKLLKYKDYSVVGGAARAFGHYADSDTKTRKSIVEAILKMYTGLENAASGGNRGGAGNSNNNAEDRLKLVRGPSESSLARLTGEKMEGASVWWKWWNDSGKRAKEWPKPQG